MKYEPPEKRLRAIRVRGAREHNLKNINIDIPRNSLVVVTGVSGSGKSSLAFDTIYAEGQRRYVESLSAYARQFLDQLEKPDCDSIEGLSPAIAIDQKSTDRNPRSTVGTVTEIYDYLRLLYARIGTPFCVECGAEILPQSLQEMIARTLAFPPDTQIFILAPIVRGRKGIYQKELEDLRGKGFSRLKINGKDHDLSEDIKLDRQKKHTLEVYIDRLRLKSGLEARVQEALETALKMAGGVVNLDVTVPGGKTQQLVFNQKAGCVSCGASFAELEPRLFSFNSPYGACPSCEGLGIRREFDVELLVPYPEKPLRPGSIFGLEERFQEPFHALFLAIIEHYKADPEIAFQKLPAKVREAIFYGTGEEKITYPGSARRVVKRFEGVVPYLQKRYLETDSESLRDDLENYMTASPCPACSGKRLRKEALAVKISGLSIDQIVALPIGECLKSVDAWKLSPRQMKIGERALKEVKERLQFLLDVGLDYLTLDRSAVSLSGGEGQRIRLATQIGSQMVGVLYVLDEPSIGLHPRDNQKLLNNLKRLRNAGNTVLVVEHDEDTMRMSDQVLDLGPGAGRLGGELVAAGTVGELIANPKSLTGKFLSGEERIEVPQVRRRAQQFLKIRGARAHNLRKVDVDLPLGVFACITGVSGSGKSSLVSDTIYTWFRHRRYSDRNQIAQVDSIDGADAIENLIMIDQSPIGRTPRSNPATYIGVFSPIRDLFAQLPDAKMRGWKPGRFSFNVQGGRCESCQGAGMKKIEMNFLPNVFVRCEICGGKRYGSETLQVRYRGASIADVLAMSVAEAVRFFDKIPSIRRKLEVMEDVGLGYITLGQSATTLSGGEAQRMKLGRELSKRGTGKTLYILDEPTTGLHFSDVRQLLKIFQRLVDQKNTLMVIEHHLDVIKSADHLIDLGPEGGSKGGEILAVGTPEEVATSPRSYTGQFLKTVLFGRAPGAAISKG